MADILPMGVKLINKSCMPMSMAQNIVKTKRKSDTVVLCRLHHIIMPQLDKGIERNA